MRWNDFCESFIIIIIIIIIIILLLLLFLAQSKRETLTRNTFSKRLSS